jgi:predicted small lipoprotein YifL
MDAGSDGVKQRRQTDSGLWIARRDGNPGRKFRHLALLLLVLILAACGSGPYHNPPRYSTPDSRTAAARQLNEALAFGGIGYSDVHADESALRWREQRQITDKQRLWVDRELDLTRLRAVDFPAKPGEHWQLRVTGAGGVLTFVFKEDRSAAKAESALRRLMQVDAPPPP